MLPPSAFTVVVPFARLLENAMFGYGTGKLFGGVLHTSGMVAMETHELPLCTRLKPLTLIVTDTGQLVDGLGGRWLPRCRRASRPTCSRLDIRLQTPHWNFGSIRNSLTHRCHQLLRGSELIRTQYVFQSLSPFGCLAAAAFLPFTVRNQTK